MIAAQQEEVFGVFDLVGQKQTDGLQRLLPSVHVVSQEQVVAFRGEASVFEESQEIIVLTVDVAYKEGGPRKTFKTSIYKHSEGHFA